MQASAVESKIIRHTLNKIADRQMNFDNAIYSWARDAMLVELNELNKGFPEYGFSIRIDDCSVRLVSQKPVVIDIYNYRYIGAEHVKCMLQHLHSVSSLSTHENGLVKLLCKIGEILGFVKYMLDRYNIHVHNAC